MHSIPLNNTIDFCNKFVAKIKLKNPTQFHCYRYKDVPYGKQLLHIKRHEKTAFRSSSLRQDIDVQNLCLRKTWCTIYDHYNDNLFCGQYFEIKVV